jgi:hypothetical protein
MRFLIRLVFIAILIALILRIVRAAWRKLTSKVEVIPPRPSHARRSKHVIIDQEEQLDEEDQGHRPMRPRHRAGRS